MKIYYIYYCYSNGVQDFVLYFDKKLYEKVLNRINDGIWYTEFEYGEFL